MALKQIEEKAGSFVNISGFHLTELTTDEPGKAPAYGDYVHVRGAQEIKVDPEQELIENWGDGEVQESAVSQGKTKVDMQAFALKLELRAWLQGLEVNEDGVVLKKGGTLNPAVVGCSFYKEKKNKDVEIVALTRGTFQIGGDDGKTAENKTDFGNASMNGEFSQRLSDGIAEYRAVIKKDDKAALDKFYTLAFGKPLPDTALPKGWTVAGTPAGV
ncbi:major tail protein [Macrococcoides bohemicum]|uniref:major tail protein n=1 Tax=Macrococcoides bohemicum TaxID=1903056 RepID=UPI00165D565F|nr:major tail protein [Macrococcus bohemicus]MBC9873696.1 hypothetical protein [Macrococcus bohemicus]